MHIVDHIIYSMNLGYWSIGRYSQLDHAAVLEVWEERKPEEQTVFPVRSEV